jgi:hypothetical protein
VCVVLNNTWHQTSFTMGCHTEIGSICRGVTSGRAAEAKSSTVQSDINGINAIPAAPEPSNSPIDRPAGSGMRVVCLNRGHALAFRLSASGTSRIQNLSYRTKRLCHFVACQITNQFFSWHFARYFYSFIVCWWFIINLPLPLHKLQ